MIGQDRSTALVLNQGGQPMPSLVKLAEREDDLQLRFVDNQLPLDEQVDQCGEAPVLILGGKPDDTLALVRRLPKLKLIQVFSAGTDWLDVNALAQLGVAVADNNGANAVAVAEQTIAMLCAVYRQLDQQFQNAKAGTWQQGLGDRPWHTFEDKRIGLVGLGRIGSRVAKRLAGWECELVFHDTAQFGEDYIRAAGARALPFDELLQSADVVSLHVPLNRLTRGMFSEREFGLMKKTAVFLNTCRGPVVDESALIHALQEDQIFAAGLDVTEVEPIQSDNPLLTMSNVLITPHLATRAEEVSEKINPHIIANAARVIRGEAPTSVVSPI